MTTAPNRELTPVSTQAHQHMKRIVSALKKRGLYATNTAWLSELILSQPMPNGNGHAQPVAPAVAKGNDFVSAPFVTGAISIPAVVAEVNEEEKQ